MKCKGNEKLLYTHLQNCYKLCTHCNTRTELDNVKKQRILGETDKLMGITQFRRYEHENIYTRGKSSRLKAHFLKFCFCEVD